LGISALPIQRKILKILMADEDVNGLEMHARWLKLEGFTVETAPTAEPGLYKPLWAEHVVKVARNLVEVLH
jgi:hypothetical protein